MIICGLALAGCQDRPKTEAPVAKPDAAQPAAAPAQPASAKGEMPKDATHGAATSDPHAGMKGGPAMPAGPTKNGKVLQVLDGGSYIYLEVQHDDGKNVWVASMPIKVSKGDKVKYSYSDPISNFPSKTLKRTFDSLILSNAVEVVK